MPHFIGILSNRILVLSPPPIASKRQSNPFEVYSFNFYSQSPFISRMFSAPSSFKISTCSCLLTTFKRGIFSFRHNLLSILPKDEAAAVCMIPFNFLSLKISTKHKAVNLFTTPDTAHWSGTSSSISKTREGFVAQ